MSEEILINVTPQETRVAIAEEGVVQELHIERNTSLGLVGNIYRGTVCRVLPGMQSAFVEIGLQRAAFLHVADVLECTNPNQGKTIQEVLHEGQPLMVQVVKEPIGTKGARLTTQISIAGRFLVYLPQQDHIGVSQRIEDEAGRIALCTLGSVNWGAFKTPQEMRKACRVLVRSLSNLLSYQEIGRAHV